MIWVGTALPETEPPESKEPAAETLAGCPARTKWIPGGCYTIPEGGEKRVFIHTRKQLMQDKDAIWSPRQKENKDALEIAKVLRAKLMKLPEVSGVRITARNVLVGIYVLDEIPMRDIEKAFEVLKKRPTEEERGK